MKKVFLAIIACAMLFLTAFVKNMTALTTSSQNVLPNLMGKNISIKLLLL